MAANIQFPSSNSDKFMAWIEEAPVPVILHAEDGRIVQISKALTDTASYKIEDIPVLDVWSQKTFLETTLISVADGIIATDKTGSIIFMNRAAEKVTGWSKEEAKHRSINKILHLIDKYSKRKIGSLVMKVIESRETLELGSHTSLISRDGHVRLIEETVSPILQEDGEISGAVIVFRDCTEKQKKVDEIRYLCYHDQLTGLYNRRFYEEELARLDTKRNYPISLIMADVNGLKLTNDAFGHAAGDNLLKRVAGILRTECRTDDILARIGGDEFVILLPKTDIVQTRKIIARINEKMANEKTDKVLLSISVGSAEKTDASISMHDVFTRAEDEMYRQKTTSGTNIKSQTIVLILSTLFDNNEKRMERSKRVGLLCEETAEAMHLEKVIVNRIRTAGLLHDIGNIGVDDYIFEKPQKLSDSEWNKIMKHPETGYRILSSVNELSEVASVVLQHQERWDGSGYPNALAGEQISMPARIVGIASAYDAMISDKAYMKALSQEMAAREIRRYSGNQFDPEIARVFVEKVLGEKW